ncbi:uncharacterized protein K441DRAFT_349310 [Cenococcum geophilum 1.58]|uniref:uncharacterized protein n=1 Tax=Cenococcum geophilum 1.58 TaxID=794803 RepID=UPI000DC9B40C|nr:hypothetical protein K441DRAFT_349310 [Cenococcum geophilum 1.58]
MPKTWSAFVLKALQSNDSEGEYGRRCRSSSPPIDNSSVNTSKNTENTVMLTYSYQERSERVYLHPKNYRWGLYVEKHLEYVDTNRNHGGRKLRRVTRPRIRFFASESTAHLQEELNSVIEYLIRNKIIRNEAQLFSDFFYAVLRHAKTQVEEVRFQSGMRVGFILAVPPICQPRARRIV